MGSETLKPVVRFASACVALALLALSIAGFDHLARSHTMPFEGATTFACLCFLGVCCGALLALAEVHWNRFFYLFGFLRYRFGRAIVFAIAGVMVALIGQNLDSQCACKSYVILIIEGVACVGMATVHLVAIVMLGNNTLPGVASSASRRASTAFEQQPVVLRLQSPNEQQMAAAAATTSPVVLTTSSSGAVVVDAPAPTRSEDPNQPAWMNA